MLPIKYDFILFEGSDWADANFTLKDPGGDPIDLTSCTAVMAIRGQPGGDVLLSPTVTLGGAAGTITPVITKAQTLTLSQAAGLSQATMTKSGYTGQGYRLLWELDITWADLTTSRVAEGLICLVPGGGA